MEFMFIRGGGGLFPSFSRLCNNRVLRCHQYQGLLTIHTFLCFSFFFLDHNFIRFCQPIHVIVQGSIDLLVLANSQKLPSVFNSFSLFCEFSTRLLKKHERKTKRNFIAICTLRDIIRCRELCHNRISFIKMKYII